MDWNPIVERVAPSIVKIETPRSDGTGFLCYRSEANFILIATAYHVIRHADEWQEPIRITQMSNGTTAFLKEDSRVIWSDQPKDSAVIFTPIGDLNLPENPIPLLPVERRLPIGVDVGWLGYPAIAEYTLCFFSGNVSAWQDFRKAYLIDGVAINGVSGGPVFYSTSTDGVQIVGSISAYRPSRGTGEALPGLCIAQDVSHFQEMATRMSSMDEANRQRQTLKQEQSQEPQPSLAEPPGVSPPSPTQ